VWVEGAPAGNHCGRTQVAVSVGGVGSLVEAQMWRALTGRKGRGRVGLGTDSSGESGNGRDHRDRVRTGAATHKTTMKQTCVLGADKWPSGAGENGGGLEWALILCGHMRQLTGRTRLRAQGYK
jgi:hypothetical protein